MATDSNDIENQKELLKRHDVLKQDFSSTGCLARTIAQFHSRPMQLEMSCAISDAITKKTSLIAEAGTGTGKTFAYLVPAIRWGGKVIISTDTKNLQDQLFLRDIPVVRKALGMPLTVALLKGRANYVCHFHLERYEQNDRYETKKDIQYLRNIKQFAQTSQTGDKAECYKVPENAYIWNAIASTRENCLGTKCPYFDQCFVAKARETALKADIVVVNHHLFFADLVLKAENDYELLLPNADTVIFDEAHQLPEIATAFFGSVFSTSVLRDLCREVVTEGLAHAREGVNWPLLTEKLEKAGKDLRLCFPENNVKLSSQQLLANEKILSAVEDLIEAFDDLLAVLDVHRSRSEVLQKSFESLHELFNFIESWKDALENSERQSDILWAETSMRSVSLHATPLSIADKFTQQREKNSCAWIFTSATLALKQDFSYYAKRMGLTQAKMQSWPSPFSYNKNALLYVPQKMPDPRSPDYLPAVLKIAIPLITDVKGGVFVLCTSMKAVDYFGEQIKLYFEKNNIERPVFIQGEAGKNDLLDAFRNNGRGVLVGSQSFWKGVDVPGSALSLVIVDKLPFVPPDDPVLAARINALEKKGGNGFMSFQVPEATMTLKQGAGRLIRNENDRGLLVICDSRLVDKQYGKRIWQSLPAFARTREHAKAREFLLSLSGHLPESI